MFSSIKKLFTQDNTSAPVDNNTTEESVHNGLQERIEGHYGKHQILEQQFYEKWCTKDRWNLKDEAVPIVLGLDPNNNEWSKDKTLSEKTNELYQHALHCIHHDLSLSVIDKEAEENLWQVTPVEFYRWAAVSRVTIPEKLSALMDFIISTVKQSGFVTDEEGHAVSPEASSLSLDFDKQTEIVLGAALNLLVKAPSECQTDRGKVSPKKIAAKILESEEDWFQGSELKLSQAAVEDLLTKWIRHP